MVFLLAAVGYEMYRRAQVVRRRRAAEWKSVRRILSERDIPPENETLLESVVKRWAPNSPLHAVTTRDGFERCVDREIAALGAKSDTKTFEETGIRLRDIRNELGLDYVPAGQRIQSTRELHDGQWIAMGQGSEPNPAWIRVMVEEVNEAYFYVVLKELPSSAAPKLDNGQQVRCRLWREEDARYVFDTTVAASEADPLSTWRLNHTSTLQRMQARAHYRVRHDQPVTVGIIEAGDEITAEQVRKRRPITRLRGRITSLSAGGCAVVVKQPVARQVALRVPLEIPGGETMELNAEIVATAPISGGRYLVRSKFLGVDDTTRDEIAKYVLHRQQANLGDDEEAK